eukprot:COSAG02_NODE_659_length_18772_cov_14.955015_5_plen_86_part_00
MVGRVLTHRGIDGCAGLIGKRTTVAALDARIYARVAWGVAERGALRVGCLLCRWTKSISDPEGYWGERAKYALSLPHSRLLDRSR